MSKRTGQVNFGSHLHQVERAIHEQDGVVLAVSVSNLVIATWSLYSRSFSHGVLYLEFCLLTIATGLVQAPPCSEPETAGELL